MFLKTKFSLISVNTDPPAPAKLLQGYINLKLETKALPKCGFKDILLCRCMEKKGRGALCGFFLKACYDGCNRGKG
ncbi:MAG: hypothetical protein DRJ98_05375 [Thermoprotei archaeon]|nr:MAG: hypothetical protein DRJ98_05375 [Thermoprotei archaeon]RLF18415.1 MAG: hypothetical protein DRN06_01555 [Thermoprotei archaeon]